MLPLFYNTQNISVAHINRRHTHQRANKNKNFVKGEKQKKFLALSRNGAQKFTALLKMSKYTVHLFEHESKKKHYKIGSKVGQNVRKLNTQVDCEMGSREMLKITRFMANNKN